METIFHLFWMARNSAMLNLPVATDYWFYLQSSLANSHGLDRTKLIEVSGYFLAAHSLARTCHRDSAVGRTTTFDRELLRLCPGVFADVRAATNTHMGRQYFADC